MFEGTVSPVLDCTAVLIENDYFTEKELPQGSQYIRALVDNLKLNMGIFYSGSKEATITGEYSIYASMIGYQSTQESGVIWQKDIVLYEKQISRMGNELEAGEKFTVNLKDYEALGTQANADFGINLTYDLYIRMEGQLLVESEDGNLTFPIGTFVSIPLNSALFTVTSSENNPISDQVSHEIEVVGRGSREYVPLCIVGIIVGVMSILVFIFCIENPSEEDLRRKKWCKELRNHKSRMLELKYMPNLKTQFIYEVNSLQDLIKLSDEIQMPIFYISDKEDIIVDNTIFLVKDDSIYLYQM